MPSVGYASDNPAMLDCQGCVERYLCLHRKESGRKIPPSLSARTHRQAPPRPNMGHGTPFLLTRCAPRWLCVEVNALRLLHAELQVCTWAPWPQDSITDNSPIVSDDGGADADKNLRVHFLGGGMSARSLAASSLGAWRWSLPFYPTSL